MVLQFEEQNVTSVKQTTRDAVRSKAWRERQSTYLRGLIHAAGHSIGEDATQQSAMAQLKIIFAPLWTQTLQEAPAELMRHDPSTSRKERRRISSVKNNRLCRLRHSLFLSKVEQELTGRGVPQQQISAVKGLVSES